MNGHETCSCCAEWRLVDPETRLCWACTGQRCGAVHGHGYCRCCNDVRTSREDERCGDCAAERLECCVTPTCPECGEAFCRDPGCAELAAERQADEEALPPACMSCRSIHWRAGYDTRLAARGEACAWPEHRRAA